MNYCNKCGAKIDVDQKCCLRCGNILQHSALAVPDSIMTLEELESLRKKVVKKEILIFIIVLVVIVFLQMYLYKTNSSYIDPQLPIMCIMLSLIIILLVIKFGRRKIKTEYKKTIVLEALKSMFSDVYYSPDRGIKSHVLRETAMIRMGDRYYSNDYISAKYKNISFEASDVLIQEEYRDSDGDKHTVTLFQGQWFIFDFNKSFKADLQVCEKGFGNNKRGGIFGEYRLKKVELEDIDFNKQFNVYAQNELDAFYVLTPNSMLKIKEVEEKVSGKLLFCFIDNKLHVGLYNHKDLFEYKNIYRPINLEREKDKVLKDIKNITEFVDVLDLDNDLYKEEI